MGSRYVGKWKMGSRFLSDKLSDYPVAIFLLALLLLSAPLFASPSQETGASGKPSIAVFIPGVMAGSPVYELLASGVKEGAGEAAQVSVIEAGYNQADWETKLTSLAASGKHKWIVSSNPALPAIVKEVSKKFPAQKFILFDGDLSGNQAVYALRFNTGEQAFLAGRFAALCARERGADSRKVGLIAAQEYPVMNEVILPQFLRGALSVGSNFETEFRVVGNWFDASAAASLASGLFRAGVPVVLTIAGGANEGVVQAAREEGGAVVWFDSDGSADREDVVLGSAIARIREAARDKIKAALAGTLPFGTTEEAGEAEGYIDFVFSPQVSEKTRDSLRK